MVPGSPSPMDSEKSRAIYRATVQQAAVAGTAIMDSLVVSARAVLQARESATRDLRERDACIASAELLTEHKAAMAKAYPAALLSAFAGAPSSKSLETKHAPVHFDQLELMDELQVQTSVVAARTQHLALQAAEGSLSELNSLVCGLLGLSTVRPERNPLRPEMYVQALREVLATVGVPAATQLEWMGMMAAPLGRELRNLYAGLCTSLRDQGVISAAYGVNQVTPAGRRGQSSSPDGQHAGAADYGSGSTGTSSSSTVAARADSAQPGPLPGQTGTSSLTLARLRQLLSGELERRAPEGRLDQFNAEFARAYEGGQAATADAGHSGFDTTVPAALEALTEMKQVEHVVQKLEQRKAQPAAASAGSGNMESVRAQVRDMARTPAQTLGLEVVTLMVDNMARDSRLLEPVQAFVRAMEPALLRLILVDPRFFTDKHHPARVLLQEITQRSLAYQRVDDVAFVQFMRDVDGVVAPLQTQAIHSAELFDSAHQALVRKWSDSRASDIEARKQTVEVLRHAEARNLLAERIARGWEALPAAQGVAGVVLDFLCGPWAQVVAQARIKEGVGSVRTKKFEAMVGDLLWSAQPMGGRENITRLTKLVPRLLETLREGVDSIQLAPTRTSAFLEQLMAIHQKVFRVGADSATAPPGDAQDSKSARFRWVEDGNPWMVPDEAHTSNFMDAGEVTAAAPLQDDSQPLLADMDLGLSHKEDLDDALILGGWVEILREGEWARTQLTWASPHNTLYLFTSSYGITQSMTRRTRDKLFEAGKLRLLSATDVVDGALDAVAFTAMQNSVHSGFDEAPGPASAD